MSERKDGGPAFPISVPVEFQFANEGMSLRDWLAGQALAGEMAATCTQGPPQPDTYEIIAKRCYGLADAMLKAREGSDQ